ncbi:MAG: hypothetical protein MUF83_10165 [Acidimicrobiales bacterium]|nr:hypothetical protein [Acidimicrobiales bacterium]
MNAGLVTRSGAGSLRTARALAVLGAVGVTVGVAGLVLAIGDDVTGGTGSQLKAQRFDVNLFTFNPLGALALTAVGGCALVGGLTRRAAWGWVAAVGATALALQVLVQWRAGEGNLLAASGTNLSLDLLLAIGCAVLSWAMPLEEQLAGDATETGAVAGASP